MGVGGSKVLVDGGVEGTRVMVEEDEERDIVGMVATCRAGSGGAGCVVILAA